MKNEKLGQEPAFARTAKISEYSAESEYSNKPQEGMSKRFYAACAAMQGFISNSETDPDAIQEIIQESYKFADELLKQEN